MIFGRSAEARVRRRRLLTYALLATSTVLIVDALVGEHGYLATVRAQREAAAMTEQIEEIRAQNQELSIDIDRLKHDPSALEEAARRALGLIKPGEKLVIIRDAQPAPRAPSAPVRK